MRLESIARLTCPVCGKGKPFSGLLSMRSSCAVCGYRFEREPGYFIGSIYFNYGVTATIEIAGYFLLEALFDLTFIEQVPIWLTYSVVFPLWFHRYARFLWMALDLSFSPPAEGDFEVRRR